MHISGRDIALGAPCIVMSAFKSCTGAIPARNATGNVGDRHSE